MTNSIRLIFPSSNSYDWQQLRLWRLLNFPSIRFEGFWLKSFVISICSIPRFSVVAWKRVPFKLLISVDFATFALLCTFVIIKLFVCWAIDYCGFINDWTNAMLMCTFWTLDWIQLSSMVVCRLCVMPSERLQYVLGSIELTINGKEFWLLSFWEEFIRAVIKKYEVSW